MTSALHRVFWYLHRCKAELPADGPWLVTRRSNTAGWHEKTPWKDGLAKTVEWYRKHGLSGYWDDDAVEKSLDAHPTYFASQNALNMPALGLPHNNPGLH